jgi:hypothetical protein
MNLENLSENIAAEKDHFDVIGCQSCQNDVLKLRQIVLEEESELLLEDDLDEIETGGNYVSVLARVGEKFL